MWFGEFLVRALVLSFAVALFWMPVLAITVYGVMIVFDLLQDEPIALLMIIVLFWIPLNVLLSVLAIRGGLMILKVTKGAEIGKLFSVTFRILRFNVPLMAVIMVLFGVATMYTVLHLVDTSYLDNLGQANSLIGQFKSYFVAKAAVKFPIIALSGWVFGYCVAFAAMGVSMAAAAAMAVAKPPNHHTIWGLGAQFWNLFVLALVVIFLPYMLFIFAFGGPYLTLEGLSNIAPRFFMWSNIYMLWASSALYAGAALAYANHLKGEEERHRRAMDELAGLQADRPQIDLAELRRSRMHKKL